jgi:transcriptional regulator with XRE-family HTH domain
MTAQREPIDVPTARPGEAFAGELPVIFDRQVTEPGWVALSRLQSARPSDERARTASGAAMAGAFVRTMRVTAGLSQEQLARAAGVSQSVISDIERGAGKIGPSFETMVRLATASGMDIGFAPGAAAAAAAPPADTACLDLQGVPAATSWVAGQENLQPAMIGRGRRMRIAKAAFELAMKAVVDLGAIAARAAATTAGPQAPGGAIEVAVDRQGLLKMHRHDGSALVLAPVAYREAGPD